MFAFVHGPWPRATLDGVNLDALEAEVAAGRADEVALREAIDRLAAEVVATQVDAGIDLVTDGQVRWPDLGVAVARAADSDGRGGWRILLDAWRATSALTDRPVAQSVPGPYALGRAPDGIGAKRLAEDRAGAADRAERTLALADELATGVRALADAGCPIVAVEEPAAVAVGEDPAERELFLEAQRRLLAHAPDLHAMLVVAGGSAHAAGPDAILGAPYRSFLFDLIDGPDNWYLVRATPGDRGVVCGALRIAERPLGDQAPLLVWAAAYAASTAGRGIERVGLANARPLRSLSPARAHALVREVGRGARLAAMSPQDAIAAGLDPRTFAQPASRRPRRRG